MAKKSIISTATNGTMIVFTVEGAGSFTIDRASLSEDIRDRAEIHGLVQKVSDGAAIPRAELPANPIDAAKVKFSAMSAIAERLADGEWSKRSGDGSGPVAGIIYRAFAEWVATRATAAKKPVPDDAAIRAVYDAKSRSEQLALRNIPEVAAIIERMKSERGSAAAAKVDAAGLLEELGL